MTVRCYGDRPGWWISRIGSGSESMPGVVHGLVLVNFGR